MKNRISSPAIFVALCLSLAPAFGQNQIAMEVLPVTDIQTIDDAFVLQVRVINNSPETVLVDIPVGGKGLGLEVVVASPDGWVKKKPTSARNSGITVIVPSGSRDALQIQPGSTQQFRLDLRDYFDVIDLHHREYSIEVKIQAFAGATKANPNGNAYPGSWSGKLSLTVKDVKGVMWRFIPRLSARYYLSRIKWQNPLPTYPIGVRCYAPSSNSTEGCFIETFLRHVPMRLMRIGEYPCRFL